MSRQPRRFTTTIFLTMNLALAATMPAAGRALAQDAGAELAADSPVEPRTETKNVPEPSAVVIAATAVAMEGWSVWKRRRRAAHRNLIGTGAAGGRSSE